MTNDELNDIARRMILYFEPAVLAAYRQDSHQYEVKTDNFEGDVGVRSDFYIGLSEEQRATHHVEVKFGYRARADGTLAIAAWAPDVTDKTSVLHRKRWAAFHIPTDTFPQELDARFALWMDRYIAGNWDVENGPIARLLQEIYEINTLTGEVLEIPLFRAERSADLLFPAAENDAAYAAAHSAVYGLIYDGFDKQALLALAKALGKDLSIERNETMKGLKSIIDDARLHAAIFDPLRVVRESRHKSDHGARPPATPFPAFERFSKEIEAVAAGLGALKNFLATTLNLDVERCIQRRERRKYLPQLDRERLPRANYSIVKAPQMIGKTISRVELGFRRRIEGAHDSEALILHFTDGSSMGIDTASNAGNLCNEANGLKPEEFSSSMNLTFVPPLRGHGSESDDL